MAQTYQMPWHDYEDSEEASRAVAALMEGLRSYRARMITSYHRLVAAYEREMYQWLGVSSTVPEEGLPERRFYDLYVGLDGSTPSHNIVKAMIDTVTSRLFAEIPRLEVEVAGADYETRLLAQRKTMALHATLGSTANRKAIMQFAVDGLKTAFGAMRPYVCGGSFRLERVLLPDLWWHPADARYNQDPATPPQSMHYCHQTSKSEAKALARRYLGGKVDSSRLSQIEQRIDDLPATDYADLAWDTSGAPSPYDREIQAASLSIEHDQIYVVHSWHLPTSLNADDGRYLIHIIGQTGGQPGLVDGRGNAQTPVVLYDGEWTRETHPIVWWTPYPAHEGLLGVGLGHVALPYQSQIDVAWPRLSRIIDQFGNPKVIYNPDAEDELENVASEDITFVRAPEAMRAGMASADRPYEVITHNAQDPQLLNWVPTCQNFAFDALGINQGVAVGASQLGANASGRALTTEDHRADTRFAAPLLCFDAALLALGQETLNALDDAQEQDSSFAVRFRDQFDSERKMKWSELKITTGAYYVRLETLGALGRTASARIRAIEQLGAMGAITPQLAIRAAFGDKDIVGVEELANAAERLIEWQLYYLVIADADEDLSPYLDIRDNNYELSLSRVTQHLANARIKRASDQTIARLRSYKEIVAAALNEQAAMQGQMAPQMAGIGAPEPVTPVGPAAPAAGVIPIAGGPVG